MQEFLLSGNIVWYLALAMAWTLPWKAVALWRSARNGQKIWFVVLLVLNTLAIFEIVYIFFFSGKREESQQYAR